MPSPDTARTLLACIRLINGGLALLAPGFLARRLGVDPDRQPAILYVFRMFGIRTVLIGADLLLQTDQQQADNVRRAVLIHASDTLAAGLAARTGRLPGAAGLTITLISAVNTLLALYARSGLTQAQEQPTQASSGH